MSNELTNWRTDDKALAIERQRMNDALALLGQVEIRQARAARSGRLIVALDLTGSREHSLKQARVATAAMFDTIKAVGAVAVKLVYYRGDDECRASSWHDDPGALRKSMRRLSCESGGTQIARVLRLALAEKETLSGVVFVGDHCEEKSEDLMGLAQTLGQRPVPLFVFHECADHDGRSLMTKPLFQRMAAASGGVYSEFKPDSGAVLRELLANVAAFSTASIEDFKRVAPPQTPEARELQGRLLLLGSARGKQ